MSQQGYVLMLIIIILHGGCHSFLNQTCENSIGPHGADAKLFYKPGSDQSELNQGYIININVYIVYNIYFPHVK